MSDDPRASAVHAAADAITDDAAARELAERIDDSVCALYYALRRLHPEAREKYARDLDRVRCLLIEATRACGGDRE